MEKIISLRDKDFWLKEQALSDPYFRQASRGIVFNKKGKIAILYKQAKNEYKLPGGGKDEGESPEETFRREVLEEIGAEVWPLTLLWYTEEIKSQTNFQQHSFVFLAEVVGELHELHLTPQEKEEGAIPIWMFPDEALKVMLEAEETVQASAYDTVYSAKFVIRRDAAILEYYLNTQRKK